MTESELNLVQLAPLRETGQKSVRNEFLIGRTCLYVLPHSTFHTFAKTFFADNVT